MRVKLGKPMRSDFVNHAAGKKIVLEADVRVTRHSRLAAKLLVFKNPKDLRQFWLKAIGGDISGALGAVNALFSERYDFRPGKPEDHYILVDPKYFCVIGLNQENLSMEVICHESVHAGFAYQRRAKRRFWHEVNELDEEVICYPAGSIAGSINALLHDNGLYK